MILQYKIIGILLILLAIMHCFFPKRFEWKQELSGLNLLNKQMMYVHTFFVALTVFGMGMLSFFCAGELTGTPFGRKISIGIGIFWLVRLYFQFFVYSPELWRGKKFETIIHIFFSLLWAYLAFAFIYTGVSGEMSVVK
jgi:hypothetical protein